MTDLSLFHKNVACMPAYFLDVLLENFNGYKCDSQLSSFVVVHIALVLSYCHSEPNNC